MPLIDAGIAAQSVLLAARERGLGGCIFGLWLANKVNGPVLKKIVYAVMLGMGVLLIAQHI